MSARAYNELLQRANAELTSDERRRLAENLSRGATAQSIPSRSIQNDKSLYDALEERGMIGSITDGPGDLSTHPKYLQGFGEDED